VPLPQASDFDAVTVADDKRSRGLRISVCLPARNEADTIGVIVEEVASELMKRIGLVDEVVVMDDGSTDATALRAAAAGATVVRVDDVLPHLGPGAGKGNALWASLHACTGDIICWLDADLRNFDAHFVTGLCAPLVSDTRLALVRGCYRRPYEGRLGEGGRVTELMARPLISQLFPELDSIVQPLGGEYAGRRSALEQIPFVRGWGVEFALLVDIAQRFGVDAIGQVDLGTRIHRNRPLAELAPQAAAILAVALRRAGLVAANSASHQLVQFEDDFASHVFAIDVDERPPMTTVEAYRKKLADERSA